MILPENLAQKVKLLHDELDSQAQILSKDRIDDYSHTFKERFGPEKLAGMDGEVLLDIMHNHGNPDSLVYWLEFKNDEELPGYQFGTIGGGSALKFGIYKRKETGAWMTGSPQKQQELEINKAHFSLVPETRFGN
jgi:5-methylcytosine-specific restriction protein B